MSRRVSLGDSPPAILWVFHTLYLLLLFALTNIMLWNARDQLGWREAVIVMMVAIQAVLYTTVYIFRILAPLTNAQIALYFGGSLVLWVIESILEPNFIWAIIAYTSQAWSAAPPRAALPLTVAMLAVFVAHFINRLDLGEIVALTVPVVAVSGMGYFIYRLVRTNVERDRVIVQLEAAKKELEAARQRESEMSAMRERERLARDLHDSLGHALVALSIQLEAIQRLYRVDPERAIAQIDELKQLTRASTDELRRALQGLRAPGLGSRPLSQALHSLASEVKSHSGLTIHCVCGKEVDQLSPATAEVIWRVAQEALTNVEKHARATEVHIAAAVAADAVTLTIHDNGVGLPPHALNRPSHYGMRGMRERVEGLGGGMKIRGSGGVTVEVELPIQP